MGQKVTASIESRYSNLPELKVASFSDLQSLACTVEDYDEPSEGFPVHSTP